MIWFGVIAVVFGIDFILKKTADKKLKEGKRIQLSKHGFFLEKLYNKGFALSKMKEHPGCVRWIQGVFMAVLFIYATTEVFFHPGKKAESAALSMILGGGASNLYDRFSKGYVVDYLGVPGIRTIVFNLSDFFIFAGGIFWFFVSGLRK